MDLPDRIGRHHVEAVVGAGGFALVVRAHDDSLQDTVAIKVLAEHWAADTDVRARFLDEARLLRRIGNQHLVTVHDIGELDDGRPYFVMDYANRGTLADRMTGRAGSGLDSFSAGTIATTLAGGLGALHEAGVIHRDVNPRNIFIKDRSRSAGRQERAAAQTALGGGLIAETERLVIGDLGLAKDVVLSSGVSVVGGTPGYQAPEQLDPDGRVRPATDVFAATAVLWEAITGSVPPTASGLAQSLSAVDIGWRPVFETGMAPDPADRYQDMDSWLEAVLGALGDTRGESASRDRVEVASHSINPYRGLASFQPEDAHLFFGRDELVARLVESLSQQPVLVVGGASGSGKSSLVRAGLIPAVASGSLKESRRWPVLLFTPRSEPLKEIAYHLDRAARSATQMGTSPVSADELAGSPSAARRAAATITDSAGGLLMVIDQFEELFTQVPSRDAQDRFLEVLAEMVDPVDSRVRLVLVMRADFYAQSALFPWLAGKINRGQVLVGPMSPAELREAIEAPAATSGLHVDPDLVASVLDEAHDDPGALPLISHALAETWRRREGATMTLAAYQQTGGVAGAIAQTAESSYAEFDDDEKEAARRLLLRLVTPGEGSSDTRQAMRWADLEGDRAFGLRRVADALTNARLLTADEQSITIAHEALIASWPRLRQWIDDSRDDLRTRQRITAAAREWDEQGREDDLLYRGTPLTAALEWSAEHEDDLPGRAREFLHASEEQHLREVETRQQADRRSRRLRNGAIAVLSMLLVVAVVASLFAFNSSRQANARLANQLATQASQLAESDPLVALALAVEAVERGSNSFETREALVNATSQLRAAEVVPATSPIGVSDALAVALSPDGTVAAVGSRQSGEIILYDIAIGQPIGVTLVGHDEPVVSIAFTPDGSEMVSTGQDGAVILWDVRDPMNVPEATVMGRFNDVVWDVDVSSDGATAVTAGEDGIVQLWDLETAAGLGAPLVDSDRDALSVAFSADDSLVFSGNGRGELMGWVVAGGEEAFAPFNAHSSDIWEIVFSPSGDSVATASSDGNIRLWDLSLQLLEEPFAGNAEDVRGVQFLHDGALLLAGDENGHVRVWDVAADREVMVTGVGHGAQVLASSIDADGSDVVTLGLDQRLMPWLVRAPGGTGFVGQEEGAFGLAVSPDGELLAVGDGSGRVRIFSTATGERMLGPVGVSSEAVWALAFTTSGDHLISGSADGSLAVIDAATGDVTDTAASAHVGAVRSVIVTEGSVLSGGDDEIVRVWDENLAPAGDQMGPHRGGVTDMAISGDGVLAVSDRSGSVHFWDPEEGLRAGNDLSAEDNAIWGVAWSPEGDRLATASDDWAAYVWEVATHDLIAKLTSLPQGGTGVAFLGEETIAATSRDGTVHLFDVNLQREIGSTLGAHSDAAWGMAVFPDTLRFATSGQDGSVEVWDALDLEQACARSAGALDEENQRRFLGGEGEVLGCR